jgi:hypothetical protein
MSGKTVQSPQSCDTIIHRSAVPLHGHRRTLSFDLPEPGDKMAYVAGRRLRCKEGRQQISSSWLEAGNTFEEVNLD